MQHKINMLKKLKIQTIKKNIYYILEKILVINIQILSFISCFNKNKIIYLKFK